MYTKKIGMGLNLSDIQPLNQLSDLSVKNTIKKTVETSDFQSFIYTSAITNIVVIAIRGTYSLDDVTTDNKSIDLSG